MATLDATALRRRYLWTLALAMLAIPTIGSGLEVFLGVYRLEEILVALRGWSTVFIASVYVLVLVLYHRRLTHLLGHLETSVTNGRDSIAIARSLHRLNWMAVVIILLYTQGGPYTVNYTLMTQGLRAMSAAEQWHSYLTDIPAVLITVFPLFFYLNDMVGRYLGAHGVVLRLTPLRTKLLGLGLVTPLFIDLVLFLYYEDRTGFFEAETLVLWTVLIGVAGAGTLLAYRSFMNGLQPLQGPLNNTHLQSIRTDELTPRSQDELGLLAQAWQTLLQRFTEQESALRLERNLSNAIINNANALVVVLDNQGRIVEFNKVCEGVTGYRTDELLGKYIWDYLIVPEQVEGVRGVFQNLVSTSLPSTYENYWRIKGDGRRLIAWSNSTLTDDQCRATYIISIGIDVTEKHRIEEELLRSKDTLDRAQAIAHIGHWDWDIVTNDLAWSDEIYRIFGLLPQEFGATYPAFLDRIHPDDRDQVTAAVAAAVADVDTPYSLEHRVMRPDGTIRFVHERGEIYRNGAGKPLRMVGTVHDITESKQALSSLDQFKSTLDQTLDCVFMFDARDLKFFYFNQGAMDQVGYSRDELLQMTPVDIKPDYDETQFREMIQPLLSGRCTSIKFVTHHRHKNGSVIPVEIFLQYISSEDRPRFVAIVRDITERQQADAAIHALNADLERRVSDRTLELEVANRSLQQSLDTLQQTQRQLVESEKMAALGGLVAGIAHEINTPIGIGVTAASHLDMKMKQYAELYDRGQLKKADFESLIQAANDSTEILLNNLKRASDMIRSFKQVAVDQSSEARRGFELCEYLHEVVRSLSPQLRKGDYQVHIDCPAPLEIFSYPGAISQVISNLILNSITHGYDEGDHGEIRLQIARYDERLRVDYRDDGKGIPKELIGRVFDPFFTTRRHAGGSGLGLHILYNIVSQTLGGSVSLESQPGRGVHFTIEFPIVGV